MDGCFSIAHFRKPVSAITPNTIPIPRGINGKISNVDKQVSIGSYNPRTTNKYDVDMPGRIKPIDTKIPAKN